MEQRGNVILFYPSYERMGDYHWFPFPYLHIGPFLERKGFNPVIIDARVSPDWKNILKKELKDALCLGITAMTGSDIKDGIEASKMSEIPVIWGGPHATALPEQTANSEFIDAVVSGPGEDIMPELANKIYNGEDISGIYRSNTGRYTFPGFNLIDIEKYRSPNNVVSAFSTNGCPFRCSFCTAVKKKYSEWTFEEVKRQILYLVKEAKFKNIFFHDGTFFVRKKRVLEIANLFIESGLDIRWKANARANSLLDYSEEEMSLLRKSGLASVFFGIESGSDRILKMMGKGIEIADGEKSAEICRQYDIEFYVSFMFAVPTETTEDLKDTINYIKKLRKINPGIIAQNCIYLPLPGTPMYEDACREGYKPPTTLKGWIDRDISSRFEERDDITWIPSNVLKEYIKIYNDEFGCYKHLYEKEKAGEYKSIFKKAGNTKER